MTDRYSSTYARAKQCGLGSLLIWGVLAGIPQVTLTVPAAYAQASLRADIAQGYTLLADGQIDRAIAAFEQIVQRNPNSVEALQGLGIAYRRSGRDAAALSTYQRILALDDDNQLALSTLGFLGEFRPEWQPIGIEALTRLLQIDPDSIDARAQRAKLLYFQGLFSQAIADYAIILPRVSDPAILGPAAEVYTYSGDAVTGLSLFDRYLAAGGDIRGDQVIAYAQALRNSGQLDQAARVLETELSRTPTPEFTTQNIRLRGALASTYAARRQFPQALEVVQPLRGRRDSRLTLARALNAVGSFSNQAEFSQEAAALYQDVLATGPGVTTGVQREALSVFSNLPTYRAAALQLTQQLRQAFPEDQGLGLQEQVLAFQLGQLTPAAFVERVRSTLPSLPTDAVQVRTMGQILSRLDPPVAQLLPLYQGLLATETPDAFLNFRVAQIFAQQGQFANARSAIAAYAATSTGSQDPSTSQLFLAEIDRREGNLMQSAQRYQAILANAQTPDVRNSALQGLATILQTQGRLGDAIALYDQLIQQNPQDFAYQLGRAALAFQAELISESEAEALLLQGTQQYENTTPPPELASLAAVLPPSEQRAGLYQRLLAQAPNNAQLQLRSLQVIADSNPSQARAQIAQLIAQNPGNLDFYFVQGEIAQQIGDFDLARQSYATVLQQQPNNLDGWLSLAGLEFQQRNFEQADRAYRQVLALDAANTAARTSLAALNAVQGRPLAAIEQLQAWQQVQASQGNISPAIADQIQQISEGLLQQRGIQPAWERF